MLIGSCACGRGEGGGFAVPTRGVEESPSPLEDFRIVVDVNGTFGKGAQGFTAGMKTSRGCQVGAMSMHASVWRNECELFLRSLYNDVAQAI